MARAAPRARRRARAAKTLGQGTNGLRPIERARLGGGANDLMHTAHEQNRNERDGTRAQRLERKTPEPHRHPIEATHGRQPLNRDTSGAIEQRQLAERTRREMFEMHRAHRERGAGEQTRTPSQRPDPGMAKHRLAKLDRAEREGDIVGLAQRRRRTTGKLRRSTGRRGQHDPAQHRQRAGIGIGHIHVFEQIGH